MGGGTFFFLMNPELPKQRRKFSWPLALTLISLMGFGLLAFIFLRIERWPGRAAREGTAELERLGRSLRDAFVDVAHLQPRVLINNRVYMEKSSAAAELTTLSRRIEVENELLHTWAGSTKRIKLHGTYAARAGFDLRQDVSVELRQDSITVRLPHASLLGIEQNQIEILAFENGFWNRISAADLQNELATLPDLAKQKATESGILTEAEGALKKLLDDRLHLDHPIRVIFQDSPTKK